MAVTLTKFGYSTLLIDSDFVSPVVGIHLGIEDTNAGLMSVLRGKTSLQSATVIHAPTGLRVIPGDVSSKDAMPSNHEIAQLYKKLRTANFEFVIVDTVPGYFPTDALKGMYGEAIIVSTPDMPSCVSAIKLANSYDKINIKHSLVVNKVTGMAYELKLKEIEEIYERTTLYSLPNDSIVPESIASHVPAVLLNPRRPFSRAVKQMTLNYMKRESLEPVSRAQAPADERGLLQRILDFLFGRRD